MLDPGASGWCHSTIYLAALLAVLPSHAEAYLPSGIYTTNHVSKVSYPRASMWNSHCRTPVCESTVWQSPPKAAPRLRMSSEPAPLTTYFRIPDQRVLKAVEKANYRAVPADIAAIAGIDIGVARQELVALAAAVSADLEVTNDGDVVYNFPKLFRATLTQRSTSQRVAELWEKAWPLIFYGIRVGFGVALLASILLVFTTIFFITTASQNSEDDRRDNRRGGGGGMPFGGGPSFNMYWGPSPFDFFFYRPYYGYYETPQRNRDPEELGFLESTFSYIFGDGDPNRFIDEERIQLVSQLIRSNGGAVTAEQLAPFLDPPGPPPRKSSAIVDEKFVLPVLTALGGVPEVTDDGDIIYVFPDLQTSAGAAGTRADKIARQDEDWLRKELRRRGQAVSQYDTRQDLIERLTPQILEEKEAPFSVASATQKFFAGALGVLNLGGVFYLGNLLSQLAASSVQLPGIFGFVQGIFPGLAVYAVGYNVIPVIRNLLLKRKNAAIAQRNSYREEWANLLARKPPSVQRKLLAAQKSAKNLRVLSSKDIAYTTAKDLAEQQARDPMLDSFDQRLKQGRLD